MSLPAAPRRGGPCATGIRGPAPAPAGPTGPTTSPRPCPSPVPPAAGAAPRGWAASPPSLLVPVLLSKLSFYIFHCLLLARPWDDARPLPATRLPHHLGAQAPAVGPAGLELWRRGAPGPPKTSRDLSLVAIWCWGGGMHCHWWGLRVGITPPWGGTLCPIAWMKAVAYPCHKRGSSQHASQRLLGHSKCSAGKRARPVCCWAVASAGMWAVGSRRWVPTGPRGWAARTPTLGTQAPTRCSRCSSCSWGRPTAWVSPLTPLGWVGVPAVPCSQGSPLHRHWDPPRSLEAQGS